jgi:hypothetical protein
MMGGPGGEMGGMVPGNGSNQPHATEYTLQGTSLPLPLVHRHSGGFPADNHDFLQVSCASSKPNGTAMNATETRGRLSARR